MAMEKVRAPVSRYEELCNIFESYIPSLSNEDMCADKEYLTDLLEWIDLILAVGKFEETELRGRVNETRRVIQMISEDEYTVDDFVSDLKQNVKWLKYEIEKRTVF